MMRRGLSFLMRGRFAQLTAGNICLDEWVSSSPSLCLFWTLKQQQQSERIKTHRVLRERWRQHGLKNLCGLPFCWHYSSLFLLGNIPFFLHFLTVSLIVNPWLNYILTATNAMNKSVILKILMTRENASYKTVYREALPL